MLSSPQDQNRACIGGTVNMQNTPVRIRFECLDIMATCTRRKPPAGLSAHGAENAPTRLVENQSRQPLVKSSREELEFEAGVKRSDWHRLTGASSPTKRQERRRSRSFYGVSRNQPKITNK